MLIGCTGGSVCSILRPSGELLPLCERKHPKASLADQVHQRLHLLLLEPAAAKESLCMLCSLYKRAVDVEQGGAGVGLLEEDCGSASSVSEELSLRRSSSASPGTKPEPC